MTGLEAAIKRAGGVTKLADLLGVPQSYVSNWKRRGLPLHRAPAIERVTGITIAQLLPGVFDAQPSNFLARAVDRTESSQ